ncbi:MAG: hypothetical protein ACWGQW_00860 [bacterium]
MARQAFRLALGSLAIQLEECPNSPLKDVVDGLIEALDDEFGGESEEEKEDGES